MSDGYNGDVVELEENPRGWTAVGDAESVRSELDESPLFEDRGAIYESKTGDLQVAFAERGDETETVSYRINGVTSSSSIYAAANEFQKALLSDSDIDEEYVAEVEHDVAVGAAQAAPDQAQSVLEHFGFQQVAADGGGQTLADVSYSVPGYENGGNGPDGAPL
jgi:hypothetical protein